MRTYNAMALLSLAALAVACRGEQQSASVNEELKHDLELAASSATVLASAQSIKPFAPTEIPQTSTLRSAAKRGAGRKVVRSSTPTVKAAPVAEVAESDVEDATVLATAEAAPAPTETTVDESIPAVPRPVPAAIPATYPAPQGAGDGASQGSGSGQVIGAVLGGILGAVIRGGGVDGDRCEIHPPNRGRNRPQPRGGGVYSPNPAGSGGSMGRGGVLYIRPRFTP